MFESSPLAGTKKCRLHSGRLDQSHNFHRIWPDVGNPECVGDVDEQRQRLPLSSTPFPSAGTCAGCTGPNSFAQRIRVATIRNRSPPMKRGDGRGRFCTSKYFQLVLPCHHGIQTSGAERRAPTWKERMNGCRTIAACAVLGWTPFPGPVRSGRRRQWRAGGAGIGWTGPRTVLGGGVSHSDGGNRGVMAAAGPICCGGAR